MILLDLKNYIQHHQEVSLSDLTNRFDLTDDAAKGMVSVLIQQGHVQVRDAAHCANGSCHTGCSNSTNETRYCWREKCLNFLSIPVQVI